MGSVTFTDDYIGSGFSSSNYLKSNTTISEIGTANSWEFVTKICMTSTQSSENGMIINQNTGNYGESGFMIFVGGSNRFSFQFFDQSLNPIAYIDSTISLQNNQWYWFKCEFTGTAYNGYISTDKETWTTIGTAASTTKVHTPTNPWRFGSSVVNSSFYLYGKIDFMETYLKINGEVAWSAIGYGTSGNITEDTLTGTAAENIAVGGTGDVEIGDVIEPTLGTKSITQNGTYNASSDNLDGYSSVTVNVPLPPTKKYNLLDRVKDDSNNEIGTVSGFFTDANNVEYAVVCLDAQYRLSSGQYLNTQVAITGLSQYSNLDFLETKETATFNTTATLNMSGYTSSSCSHCRSQTFTIDGTTYYGQLPNIVELIDIFKNRTTINTADTSASSYSSLILANNKNVWSSTQYYANGYTLSGEGLVGYSTKSNNNFVIPVLEIPNT